MEHYPVPVNHTLHTRRGGSPMPLSINVFCRSVYEQDEAANELKSMLAVFCIYNHFIGLHYFLTKYTVSFYGSY